ncbi:MAG: tetratricopeptide repeat protein [Deltaproteobacteria bacterium]|nr:tetratricopeptide repeat protein [Deltaproteobacteria bacterium]
MAFRHKTHCPAPPRPPRRPERRPGRAVLWQGLVLALGLGTLWGPAPAWASARDGMTAYQQEDYPRARQEFSRAARAEPGRLELTFNLGAAAYCQGDYPAALEAFRTAAKSPNQALANRAAYNLGNTYFRLGEKELARDPEETVRQWRLALAAYGRALKLNPADSEADHNREVVRDRLADLETSLAEANTARSPEERADILAPPRGNCPAGAKP